MSKSEKRYFKLNNSKDSSIYIKVFDLIEKQEKYNAEPLKELLETEKIQSSLARIQHHLYQLILKSLGQFHAQSHPQFQVLDAIKYYIILRDRGLHEQGRGVLLEALDIAQKNNYYGLVLEISNLMEDWVTEEDDFNKATQQKQNIIQNNHQTILYSLSVLALKEKIYGLRLFYLQHQFARTKEQKSFLLHALSESQKLLEKEENPLKKRLLLTINIYAYYGLQDYENLILTEQKRLDLLHENATAAQITPFLKFAYHRNLLWILLRSKNYKAHQDLLGNIQQSPVLFENSNYYNIKLQIAQDITTLYAQLEQRHYHQAYHLIPHLWQLYKKYPNYWDNNLLINSIILFMNISFCLGKYSESLEWLNWLEQNIAQSYLLPYHNMGRVVHLLIHDGLNNHQYIRNVLESTRIKLYRKQNFFEIATVFLKYFKRSSIIKTTEEKEKLLLQYKKQMQEIAQQEEQKGFFILFNFVNWFDCKLKNCTIAELNLKF